MFEVIEERGKGGHWLVSWNGRTTTIPQSKGGDLKPDTLGSILERLGIDPRRL
jgi:predicted RNA binding protein YcfA (HicA-like mRNA interferase family)